MPTVVNAPLDFALKNLDPDHPYLSGRGFTPETIARFGLGYCSRGLMKDRIAIQLHNGEGKLIGYSGRVVDDAAITEENPDLYATAYGMLADFVRAVRDSPGQ